MRNSLRFTSAAAIAGLIWLSACGGGGGGGGGSSTVPMITPTPFATASPIASSTILCTSSGQPQSIHQQPESAGTEQMLRRLPASPAGSQYAPGIVEIVYDAQTFAGHRSEAQDLLTQIHGSLQNEFSTPALGLHMQIVSVPQGEEENAVTRAASSSLVQSASRSAVRYTLSTTAALTNDPYYRGFTGGNTPPFYEGTNIPGQWDMHEICAANAWGYANSNTTGRTYSGAAGGTVPIAIVDTGADLTHPELSGRVTYSETDINGVTTTGNMHDNDGHGTDVAGIAGDAGNNSFGFVGVGYKAPLQIYKVFPDPPSGGCPAGSTNSQCEANGSDVGLAVTNAVAHGAKVINLSLGASTPDTAEENAVAAAIAAGVVVVAAAGNESSSSLDYPGRDPGVIAVGASALDDTNPLAIVDKVASYSNYDASNPNSWGVVAPGGDPCPGTSGSTPCGDNDNLHWIENIYTSTASDSSSACGTDFASESGNCRVLIAGTSQATPHVSGAVAIMLSLGSLLTPAMVKSTLCSTSVPVPGGKSGCGRLDVYRAVAQIVGDPNP